jgi:Fe-S-cluster-containing dehydrogenase component
VTALPPPGARKLGLVIDLDICVGCHACAVACKSWNEQGQFGPLLDIDAQGAQPEGVWFNRVHTYEVQARAESGCSRGDTVGTVHFPRSCLHCEIPDCVTVCPTGASYKRAEDGIVLVDESICIGCKLCSWACPYGAREYSEVRGTMQKCTLCVDRIYNENLLPEDREPACVRACPTRARHFGDLGDPLSNVSRMVAEREGFDLGPEFGYRPVNKYLPPRKRQIAPPVPVPSAVDESVDPAKLSPLLRWIDRALSR